MRRSPQVQLPRHIPNMADQAMCLGIPGRVVEVSGEGEFPTGVVDFGGVRREVCLAYVADQVALGDYVIVHVGFAISKVDEAEAKRTFEMLREMSRLDELDWIAGAIEPGAPMAAAITGSPELRGSSS